MERLAVLQAMYATAHGVYVANMMLNIAPLFLSPDQEFITNIKHIAYSTNNDREKVPRLTFYSNADESDNRI